MKLADFEVTKIGPFESDLGKQFARCEISIWLRSPEELVQQKITLSIAVSLLASDAIGSAQEKILQEAKRTLAAAVSTLDGKDVQAVHASAEQDARDRAPIEAADWESRNPPSE
jgi:hypothetical protein